MKVEIIKTNKIIEEIEIDLPYYFELDNSELHYFDTSYGRITQTECIIIRKQELSNSQISYEVERVKYKSLKDYNQFERFINEGFNTSKEDFYKIMSQLKNFLAVYENT